MSSKKEDWTERLAQHARDFPPPPPRFASIELACEPGQVVKAVIARSHWSAVQSLFPGKDDDAIVNALVADLIERFGLRTD